MTRTSLTHPLEIASVSPGKGMGEIGITFCPGKKQPSAKSKTAIKVGRRKKAESGGAGCFDVVDLIIVNLCVFR